MQNLTILASAIPEISLGASKFKVGRVTLTTTHLMLIRHSYAGTWHSLPVYEIWQLSFKQFQRFGWCSPKFRWFTWPDHAPFRDGLPSVGKHLLRLAYIPNF